MAAKSPPNTNRWKIEAKCLARTLMPDDETLERTFGTIVLFIVWAAIVLGPMYTSADPARYEISVGTTIITWTVIGRMWDFETKRALNDALPGGSDGKD